MRVRLIRINLRVALQLAVLAGILYQVPALALQTLVWGFGKFWGNFLMDLRRGNQRDHYGGPDAFSGLARCRALEGG